MSELRASDGWSHVACLPKRQKGVSVLRLTKVRALFTSTLPHDTCALHLLEVFGFAFGPKPEAPIQHLPGAVRLDFEPCALIVRTTRLSRTVFRGCLKPRWQKHLGGCAMVAIRSHRRVSPAPVSLFSSCASTRAAAVDARGRVLMFAPARVQRSGVRLRGCIWICASSQAAVVDARGRVC